MRQAAQAMCQAAQATLREAKTTPQAACQFISERLVLCFKILALDRLLQQQIDFSPCGERLSFSL